MASIPFTQSATLGDDSVTLSARFVDNTRIWAGGSTTFSSIDTISLISGTLTANACTIKVQGGPTNSGIGTHGPSNETGTFNLSNVQIQSHDNGGNISSNNDWTFNDVTWISTGLSGQSTFGSWRDDIPTYLINGFNVWFNPVVLGGNIATGVFFPGVLTASSELNGISLWNGQTGDGILGAAITFRNQVFSGLASGPIGFVPSGGVSGTGRRVLYRCEGNASNPGVGMLLGYDYRGIHGQDGAYVFGVDNGSTHWMINPLQGTANTTTQFGNVFNSSADSSVIVAIGHQPSSTDPNTIIVNNDVVATSGGNTVNTMYFMPGTLSAASAPTVLAGNMATMSTIPHGFLIGVQGHTVASGGFVGQNVTPITTKTYRTYSWSQNDWGTVRSITPSTAAFPGAVSDANVEALRVSGAYPDVTASGYVTSFDINEEEDLITAGFSTPAAATSGLHGTGRASNARDTVASVKLSQYNAVAPTNNDGLVYSVSGTAVDFGLKNLTFQDSNATPDHTDPTIIIPTSSLNLDATDTVTSIAANDITVVGTILTSTNTKASLIGSNSIILSGASAQNFTATAPTFNLGGGGSISSSVLTGNELGSIVSIAKLGDGNTYRPSSGTNVNVTYVSGLTAGNTYTPEQLLGDGYTIPNAGIGNTVTINSPVAIKLEVPFGDAVRAGDMVERIDPTITSTYTHQKSPDGGSFALFSRAAQNSPWTQVEGTLRAIGNTAVSLTVEDAAVEHLSLWKPKNTTTYTHAQYWNHFGSGQPTKDATYTITTLNIPGEILSEADLPTIEGVSTWENIVVWEAGENELAGQLTGSFRNTDVEALGNAETQVAMRQAFLSNDYFDLIVADVQTANPKLLDADIVTDETGRADYIIAASSVTTEANGDFIELLSSDGRQQKITALINTATNKMSGVLSAVLTGDNDDYVDGIVFDAVEIGDNPDGISEDEVVNAVNEALSVIKANQQVLLTATQRGSVKAATYTAGNLSL